MLSVWSTAMSMCLRGVCVCVFVCMHGPWLWLFTRIANTRVRCLLLWCQVDRPSILIVVVRIKWWFEAKYYYFSFVCVMPADAMTEALNMNWMRKRRDANCKGKKEVGKMAKIGKMIFSFWWPSVTFSHRYVAFDSGPWQLLVLINRTSVMVESESKLDHIINNTINCYYIT